MSTLELTEANSPCCVCGSTESSLLREMRFEAVDHRVTFRVCSGCGLLFQSPRPADLSSLYETDYYVFKESETARYERAIWEARRHLDPEFGLTLQSASSILEVGSAQGHLLQLLRALGHDTQGVEISPQAARQARSDRDLNVFTGSLEEFADTYPDPRWDIVWCNDLIEHVPDPRGFIQNASALLRPGGHLVLDTPNACSEAGRSGERWWTGFNPYHVYLFSDETLRRLCRDLGLTVEASFTYHNLSGEGVVRPHMMRRRMAGILEMIGLLDPLRRLLGRPVPDRSHRGAEERVLDDTELLHRYEETLWYHETPDARAPLASGNRGNNLVLHAGRSAE